MMTPLTLAMTLVAAQPVAEPPVDNEIEVIGNKLRDWRGNAKLRKGVATCKTKRSTGDKAIDAIGCDAMVWCFQAIAPEWAAINGAKLNRTETEKQFSALMTSANVGSCVFEKRKMAIDALVAARRGKRT